MKHSRSLSVRPHSASAMPASWSDKANPGTYAGERPAVTGPTRLEWADTAKGLSIFGVVLLHVFMAVPFGHDTWWAQLSIMLDPIRMPLFFLVSGLFAHRIIERTAADLWYRRLWFLLVPYLVFTPIQAYIRLEFLEDLSWQTMLKAILLGDPGLWFLHSLMLYNIAVFLLRHQPPHLAIMISAAPLLLGSFTPLILEQGFRNATLYAPIFFIGVHYRETFFALARHATDWRVAAPILGLYLGYDWVFDTVQAYLFADWTPTRVGLAMPFAILSTVISGALGVVLAVWLGRIPLLGAALTTIGRHTLPIYVSHHAILHVWVTIVMPYLVAEHRELVEPILGPNPEILIGLAVCGLTGWVFYLISRVPVLGWGISPPPLPRPHHSHPSRSTL